MSVHREGTLTVVAGDLQTTHRGRTVALKMIDWGSSSPVLALLELKGSVWVVVRIVEEFDDRNDGQSGYRFEMEAEKAGGVANYIKQILVPKVNAALLELFPPSAAPAPEPTDRIAALDAAIIGALRWAPQADGTLRVTSTASSSA